LTHKVSSIAAKMAQSPTGDRKVKSPALPCDGKPKKFWHHLGMGFSVQQYDIGERKHGLQVPVLDNAGLKKVEPLHDAEDSAFEDAAPSCDVVLSPKKMYPPEDSQIAGRGFRSEVTMGANCIREESGDTPHKFYLDSISSDKLNQHLGRTLAIHFLRSGVFAPHFTELGLQMLRTPEAEPMLTEMMGMKVFPFVRIALDGEATPQIREIVNGRLIGRIIPDKEYEDRKLIKSPQASESGGAMPLIPGVYQIHALFEAGNGSGFSLKLNELHCDGDPLYVS
jgi:hypothetical protein